MIRIGITHGDINGIGYEVILKTFQNEEMLSLCTPVIYGSPKVATYHRKALDIPTNFIVRNTADEVQDGTLNMVNCFGEDEIKVEFGTLNSEAQSAALVSLDCAIADLRAGKIDALVTAPISQSIFNDKGAADQTHYICMQTEQQKSPLTIYIDGTLRIAMATDNLPISQVARSITKELVASRLVALHNSLKRDFFIDNPRIAVLSLNPKNGEGQFNGTEETDVMIPTLEEMFKAGLRCFGPYAAEDIFANGGYKHFDAVLAMFTDQGITPFKTLTQGTGICYTASLSHVIAAPSHGVAFDIAGKGMAEEAAFRNALYAAIDIARCRSRYDSERAHPLRKQYYEKRDDSDKLKLDQDTDDATL